MKPRFAFVLFTLLLGSPAGGTTLEAFSCEVALGLASRELGVGPRGFLGQIAKPAPGRIQQLHRRGIVEWSERVFVVRSLDHIEYLAQVNAMLPDLVRAPVHDLKCLLPFGGGRVASWVTKALDHACFIQTQGGPPLVPNRLMTGLYAVASRRGSLERIGPLLGEQALYEVNEQNHIVRVDPDLVRERFSGVSFTVREENGYEGPHLEIPGFFHPPRHLILDLEKWDAPQASSTLNPNLSFSVAMEAGRVILRVREYNPTTHASKPIVVKAAYLDQGRLTFAGLEEEEAKLNQEFEGPSPHPLEVRFPLARLRRELLDLGVRTVDLTNVWELHHLMKHQPCL